MAFNPFLSMNEPAAPVTTDVLNPFMMSDAEPAEDFTGDNPFAASNPFSDFEGGYEPPAGDTVPIDIFGTADPPGMGAKQFEETPSLNVFDNQVPENDKLTKPTDLELVSTLVDSDFIHEEETQTQAPVRPLPPETQNLILSVTGQMEFTSSHLLDRIPPTRTPSPVSVRDIHSPSPTPEPDLFEDPMTVEKTDVNRNKAAPVRPPPARPPRPAPPQAPPPRPQALPQVKPQAPVDDINLFDAPAPVTVKPTKEAILSLYSAPKKEEKPMDFLSDDIVEDILADADMQHSNVMTSVPTSVTNESTGLLFNETPATTTTAVNETSTMDNIFSSAINSVQDSSAPMDYSEPAAEVPAVVSTDASPFTEHMDVNFQTSQTVESEKNPFETADVDDNVPMLDNQNIFGVSSNDTFMASETDSQVNAQNDTGVFNPEASHVDSFTSSPMKSLEPDQTNNIFETNQNEVSGAQTSNLDWDTGEAFTSSPMKSLEPDQTNNIFETNQIEVSGARTSNLGWDTGEAMAQDAFPESQDAFDAFSAKFESAPINHMAADAWGDDGSSEMGPGGFEAEAFDPFLSMGAPPPPAATPRLDHQGSRDSTDDTFSVCIRPKDYDSGIQDSAIPVLAPPPRPQALPESPRVNPFDKSGFDQMPTRDETVQEDPRRRSGSGGETPPTPLFDEDVSVPLEDFPRTKYTGPGWEMHLRQPNKKKITGQRFWKKIFVRLAYQGDNPVVQLLNAATDKEPFQELPLQACYSVSEVGAQQFDQFGKIFTVKLQYVFYKERPGVRPGQVTKAERITNKLSQFAAYAIQGDYQGVKEFGSDLRKLGLPVEHAPQVSQLFKVGSLSYEDVKQFSYCVEEALFRLSAHRDRALTYKMEEVQITAVDELYVEQDAEGSVTKQIARVRVFFLGFLSGMPDVELGVNDLRRQGREVVGRHDIIPVATEEWIRVEEAEFHACVQPEAFDESQIIKFKPPDACYIELMRFRVRPPRNRELPLQLKAVWCVTGNKVELRADVLVPGFTSRALGQVPCEDVAARFPIPECWIYLFRVEKHFRYGSVKSAHRRTGKIKGIERFLGAVDTLQESLIEVTSGQAKYEHQHRAIVWRMPRLPKEGQGAYTTHNLVCRMALTSYDQVPEELARWATVEFTMPATQVSHTTIRSVSLQNHDSDPPEKYVRYLARHEYIVGIERTSGSSAPAYSLAAATERSPAAPAAPAAPTPAAPQPPSSDSDSD